MRNMHSVLSQWEYQQLGAAQENFIRTEALKRITPNELVKVEQFRKSRPNPRTDAELGLLNGEQPERFEAMKSVLRAVIASKLDGGTLSKAGVTSLLGYNFYDLRAPVFLAYPVNTPIRNMLPREGRVNDGYGTAANWKGTRNPGIQPFGVPEGQRGPTATPDENNYVANYKEGGVERGVTFTAQFAGEGYADNLADEHLRGLHELFLVEEGTMLLGNGGTVTGGNGFALGTAPTPTLTQATPAGGTFSSGNTISVAVVLISGMGQPANSQYGYGAVHTVSGGLIPSYTQTGADGGKFNQVGGTSAISAISSVLTLSGSNTGATAIVPAATNKAGAFAYAWFVSTAASPTLATCYLYAITTAPSVTIAAAVNTANQNGAAAGLNVDNSFSPLDFTGLLSYVAAISSASIYPQWTDLRGASLTAAGHGTVSEIETILENNFLANQTGFTEIWGSADAILALSRAIIASGSANTGYQFMTMRDAQNNIIGGFVVSGYVSRYAVNSPTGANVIPLRIHPMMPLGTLYFHLSTNPYPHSRIGNPFAMFVQREYYSIEWPVVTRNWQFGSYVHEVLASRLPWIPAVLTGIGVYTGV